MDDISTTRTHRSCINLIVIIAHLKIVEILTVVVGARQSLCRPVLISIVINDTFGISSSLLVSDLLELKLKAFTVLLIWPSEVILIARG